MTGTPVRYDVGVADLPGHRFAVTLRFHPTAGVQRLSLPVWIPGSYLVREFARHLSALQARQGARALTLTALDKCTWQLECTPGKPVEVRYQVYAFDNSVRSAWLDAARGFFNGTSLFLRVEGQDATHHEVTLKASQFPARWQLATGLASVDANPRGFGRYQASGYDELVDCPVELGDFWRGEFKACGVPHQLVVAGAPPSFDPARLLADCQRICETEIRFWHGKKSPKPPFRQYVFLLNVVDDNYGGLEHRNSTALICGRRDLPRRGVTKTPEGYTTLLGLISHEYFHTWNVKRLRPAEFTQYDYTQENYTQLLWFFEGFTSYYDDLLLRRAGLIDDATYLKLLGKTINQVMQTPGQAVQSVAQASFDAWTKYYRIDENTPNATVSYYTKGALLALCFDLSLRDPRGGLVPSHLDAVMRGLWRRCKAGPLCEADFCAVLSEVGQRSFAAEVAAWVQGTGVLPLQPLLQAHGVAVICEPAALAQQLGLRVSETAGTVVLKNVLRGSPAERAGMAAGDEWLGVDNWRLHRLDDLPLYAGAERSVTALVARDQRLLHLKLQLPEPQATQSWRLAVQDAARVGAWLAATH